MSDWEGLVTRAGEKPVWSGKEVVSRTPWVVVWWNAWREPVSLQVGVTGGEQRSREVVTELAAGISEVVAGTLDARAGYSLEVHPALEREGSNGKPTWTAKTVVKVSDGRLLEGCMSAIERWKRERSSGA